MPYHPLLIVATCAMVIVSALKSWGHTLRLLVIVVALAAVAITELFAVAEMQQHLPPALSHHAVHADQGVVDNLGITPGPPHDDPGTWKLQQLPSSQFSGHLSGDAPRTVPIYTV
jgi:hypothetical protein